ncbi:FAD-dependent tricarballylate dehydrogenase TcuA [Salipiger sp.]|uniref:FAD-dependent tricarballylate dehydrogenase TcuA n=1 Tax=Salipiger sp. TaxID=2078585 RepID=UPI003A96B7E9
MAKDYTYDVLVIGAGNAALTSALAALDQGVSVGILEKAPKKERGGNSMFTGHMRFAYDSVDQLKPLMANPTNAEIDKINELLPAHTKDDLTELIMRVTDYRSDQEMLEVHVEESYNTINWLASKGHRWVPNFGPRAQFVLSMDGGGHGLQSRNFGYVEAAGGNFHYETSATNFLQDDTGRVTGVRALTPDGYVNFHAKSVVLACGGFEANAEMRARYLGHNWDTVHVRGVPFNTGDGIRMALDIGAMPHGSWSTCHASPQDYELPKFKLPSQVGEGGHMSRYMYTFSIMVNSDGERFVDEASDLRSATYAKMGRAIIQQPGGVAYQIMDAKVRRTGLFPSSYEHASSAKADTLEKLAEIFDIDAKRLVRTVNEFNAAVPKDQEAKPSAYALDGVSTEGLPLPKSNFAMTIDEAPFEAYIVRAGITFTFGGVKIEPKTGKVQHVSGRAIPGLWAAGELVGGLFHGSYASGSGMMAGANWGRISGTGAAKAALEMAPAVAAQ